MQGRRISIARQDLVLAVDNSGSPREDDDKILKDVAAGLGDQ